MRFGDEYQVFRSELQIALNSNDNYDYVYDFAHSKKISTWSAATSGNPSASLTGKPALHHMGDLFNNRVVQKNNGVNAKQDYREIEENVPHVKRFSLNVPAQQTRWITTKMGIQRIRNMNAMRMLSGRTLIRISMRMTLKAGSGTPMRALLRIKVSLMGWTHILHPVTGGASVQHIMHSLLIMLSAP